MIENFLFVSSVPSSEIFWSFHSLELIFINLWVSCTEEPIPILYLDVASSWGRKMQFFKSTFWTVHPYNLPRHMFQGQWLKKNSYLYINNAACWSCLMKKEWNSVTIIESLQSDILNSWYLYTITVQDVLSVMDYFKM